jgi:glutamyl-tRNA synthetase
MVRLFDIADVNKSASAFDGNKLAWLNQQHMIRSPADRVVPVLRWHLNRAGIEAANESQLEQIVAAQRERAKTVLEMAANSLFFFRAPAAYDEKAVRKNITADVPALLTEAVRRLSGLADWSGPAIHALISGFAAEKSLSLGKLAQPMRLAVSGGVVSPPIDATLAILGKTETLSRLARALSVWGA